MFSDRMLDTRSCTLSECCLRTVSPRGSHLRLNNPRLAHVSRRYCCQRCCHCYTCCGPRSGEGGSGLDAGTATIWLCALTRGFAVDSFTLSASEIVSSPFGGTPASVPGEVEAEHFDEGGQGLAYFDTSHGNKRNVSGESDPVDVVVLKPMCG